MAVRHLRTVIRPHTIGEAWAERAKHGDEGRFLAGGIDLVLFGQPTIRTLIDLAGLGLDEVRRDGDDLVVGSMATLTAVLESPLIVGLADGFLSQVLHRVASPLQRNLATIGGAVARAHPWSDVIPALLVLGADLDIYDGSERRIGLDRYHEGRVGDLSPLVLAVRLRIDATDSAAAFEKFTRTAFDVGALNCACLVSGAVERCDRARLAIGGTPALAKRLPEAEAALLGRALEPGIIDAVAKTAAEEIDARDDRRASAAYRRVIARVGMRRCLERVAQSLEARR